MMGSVGPDDDFSDNVIPFSGSASQKEVGPNLSPEEEDLKHRHIASHEAGLRRVTSIVDVIDDDEKLQYVIQDLLPDTGMMYIGGISGTGKTILAIQLVANIVRGEPTMTWTLGEKAKDIRAMMLSLEMGKKELQLRLQHQMPDLSDEERKLFHENFLVYHDPEPFELWNPVHVVDLIRLVKHHKINLLLIDSASVSFASSLKDDKQVNESIKNLYMIRSRLNLAVVCVSHTRKPPAGIASNPEDVTINELFGHSGVAQSASSIFIVVEDEAERKKTMKPNVNAADTEKLVHIVNVKSRFGANAGAFKARLTSKHDVDNGKPLQFYRHAIPLPPMTEEQKRKAKSMKAPSFGETLAEIDFSLLGDEDDDL